jgi:hypothetical protein
MENEQALEVLVKAGNKVLRQNKARVTFWDEQGKDETEHTWEEVRELAERQQAQNEAESGA